MSRQDDLDNHADQLNPNNDEFWNSRGEEMPQVNSEGKGGKPSTTGSESGGDKKNNPPKK